MSDRHTPAHKVLVTGGSRGIGAAVVEAFAARGHPVVSVARSAEALDDQAGARPGGGHVQPERCDVTDEAAVAAVFDRHPDVEVLVNNAGTAMSAPLRRTSLEDWDRMLRVNATSAFLCTRAALDGMRERGRGRIVMVASSAGLEGAPYVAAYTASKHAMVGLCRAVASEVAGTGVTVNAVCPSFVDTDMTRRTVQRISDATGRSTEHARESLLEQAPSGRLLSPEEVAAAVLFLASDEAAAINGQTLPLGTTEVER